MIWAHHVVTMGSGAEGAAAATSGAGYVVRKRRFLSYILTGFLLVIL